MGQGREMDKGALYTAEVFVEGRGKSGLEIVSQFGYYNLPSDEGRAAQHLLPPKYPRRNCGLK